jgi:hypothetical protein
LITGTVTRGCSPKNHQKNYIHLNQLSVFHVHGHLLNLHIRSNRGSSTDSIRPYSSKEVFIMTSDDEIQLHKHSAQASRKPIHSYDLPCTLCTGVALRIISRARKNRTKKSLKYYLVILKATNRVQPSVT